MKFHKYKKTLIYKEYSLPKIIIRYIEFRLKNFFYFLILKFNKKKSNKPIINLKNYYDTRFINFLFYSLKDNYNFAYKNNIRELQFLKKIGIKNFLKHTLPEDKIKKKSTVYNLYINSEKTKVLKINTDYFKYINNASAKKYLVMPYYMYPEIYNNNYKRYFFFKEKFKFRIFFSGGMYKKVYSRFTWEENNKQLLNRNEVLDLLLKEFKNEIFLIKNKNDLKNNKIFKKKIIFCLYDKMLSKKKYSLNFEENFELQSNSAFTLNCPGVVMPVCHHLIEGIKVGSIPITPSYNLIYPHLNNNIALRYNNKQTLIKSFYRALEMKHDDVEEKRRQVKSFYTKNLSPEVFRNKFIQNLELKNRKDILACNDHESVYKYRKLK